MTDDGSALSIVNGRLLDHQGITEANLILREGRIEKINPASVPREVKRIDAQGKYVCPGFIDLQVNGCAGVDFGKLSGSDYRSAANFLSSRGVTSFLGTLITQPPIRMREAMNALREADLPNLLGFHLEGPFISESKRGAHNPEHILKPSAEKLNLLIEGFAPEVKLLTLAPELEGAREVIDRALERGITVSAGHTDASFEEALQAVRNGVSSFTHLYNGMKAFHHRRPGTVGAALESEAYACLIADGIHLHPAAIRLALRSKSPKKICLCSDSIAAAGMEERAYTLGDQRITLREGEARLADGTLAGSVLTMDQAVGNYLEFTDLSLPEAVAAATWNPAKILGIADRKGSIEEGKDADLTILDRDLNVEYTIVDGEVLYPDESSN